MQRDILGLQKNNDRSNMKCALKIESQKAVHVFLVKLLLVLISFSLDVNLHTIKVAIRSCG